MDPNYWWVYYGRVGPAEHGFANGYSKWLKNPELEAYENGNFDQIYNGLFMN